MRVNPIDKVCAVCRIPFRTIECRKKCCSPKCGVALTARKKLSIPIEDRFWSYVNKTDACWLWTGAIAHNGYGFFVPRGRKMVRAHRFAYELANGPIARGLILCHKCDNPPCVRPDHLFPGTGKDNMQDAVAKGRISHGDKHYAAKLTTDDVCRIRSLRGIVNQCELADEYGLSQSSISSIQLGKHWSHLLDHPSLAPFA